MIVTSQWGSYKTRSTQAFPAIWTHFKFVCGWHDYHNHDMMTEQWWWWCRRPGPWSVFANLSAATVLLQTLVHVLAFQTFHQSGVFSMTIILMFMNEKNYMDWLRIDLNPLLQAQWWPPGWFIHSCSHPPFAWSSSWFKSIGMMIMGWL